MPLELTPNLFRDRIRQRLPQIGLWCCMTGPEAIEIAAGSGYDWLLLDAEHTPNDVRTIQTALQIVAAYPVQPVVRPPVGDPVLIKRYLDVGAQTLLIPMVETAGQARMLVAATRYPPEGFRGVSAQTRAGRWGRIPGYLQKANGATCLLVQIETKLGMENAARIAEVDGVDGIFIGPSDLAASMGRLGEPDHPEVLAAVRDLAHQVRAANKPVGILTQNQQFARACVEGGFAFVAVGTDTALLARTLSDLRASFSLEPPAASRLAVEGNPE